MTKQEVLIYLHTLKWFLFDLRFHHIAGIYENAELKLLTIKSRYSEYVDMVLRPGRRGRVTLVLSRPIEARALVLLRWLLRNIEE